MEKVYEIKKLQGCKEVRFESGEKLRVPLSLFRERGMKVGEAIDVFAYREFMLKRGYPHALDGAVRLLALCDRSEHEIRTRLAQAGYPDSCIENVIAKLYTEELLDDKAFAERWAQSRAHKHGRSRIARELSHRGVDREVVDAAVSTLSDEDQLKDAIRLTGKFLGRTQGDFDRKLYQRTLAMLARHGYDASIAKRALQAIAAGEDETEYEDEE